MFHSPIYKKYFPIRQNCIEFSEKEKSKLYLWIQNYHKDLRLMLMALSQKCERMGFPPEYKIESFWEKLALEKDPLELMRMISNNYIEDEYIELLNMVLYKNRYKAFMNFIRYLLRLNPFISKEHLREILKENKLSQYELLHTPLEDLANRELERKPHRVTETDIETKILMEKYK